MSIMNTLVHFFAHLTLIYFNIYIKYWLPMNQFNNKLNYYYMTSHSVLHVRRVQDEKDVHALKEPIVLIFHFTSRGIINALRWCLANMNITCLCEEFCTPFSSSEEQCYYCRELYNFQKLSCYILKVSRTFVI